MCNRWYHISCLDKCTKKEVTHSVMKEADFVGLCCSLDGHIHIN